MFKLCLIKKTVLLFLMVCIGSLFLCGCSSASKGQQDAAGQYDEPKTLFAYVGANLQNPVTELAEAYEQETGVIIELTFNSSGVLLTQLGNMKSGDIYMPGGMSFVEMAMQNGHIDQVMGPIAYHTPVIITPKGNPAQINSIEDLANEGVKLIVPDKDATALGKTIFQTFDSIGLTAEIEKNIIAVLETPPKVLVAITMGQGNAGIVEYSNTFKERENIEIIEIDPLVNEVEEIPIASLVYAADKDLVSDFMNYVKENGPAIFKKHGFKTE